MKRSESRQRYDDTVDLHGMYAEEAMALLSRVIRRCGTQSRSILVIHGNGTGTLRLRVRNALRSGRLPCRAYFFGEDIGAPGQDGVTVIHT